MVALASQRAAIAGILTVEGRRRGYPMAAMRATLLLATAEGLLHPPPLLTPVVNAAIAAASSYNGQGKERDGSWCCEPERLALEGALRGLHGRKLAWWLDAPRPLRQGMSASI